MQFLVLRGLPKQQKNSLKITFKKNKNLKFIL